MIKHRMSIWFEPGHDEELARKEALEEFMLQVEQKTHYVYAPPRVALVRDSSSPVRFRGSTAKSKGFRVAVQGFIMPKFVS